jgi:hypothetical protein
MRIVAVQELRDVWLGGHGLPLVFAFSLLLSVVSYLVATNRGLNFLERCWPCSPLPTRLAANVSAGRSRLCS